jgi:hypothetical protein
MSAKHMPWYASYERFAQDVRSSREALHTLHRVAMMGVIPSNQLGRWRRGMAHVGNPDVVFAPPGAIDAMMEEFCLESPAIRPGNLQYDAIPVAARVSSPARACGNLRRVCRWVLGDKESVGLALRGFCRGGSGGRVGRVVKLDLTAVLTDHATIRSENLRTMRRAEVRTDQ